MALPSPLRLHHLRRHFDLHQWRAPPKPLPFRFSNNGLFQGNRTFEVYLFTNAQSGIAQLLQPTNATVTIIDDVAAH